MGKSFEEQIKECMKDYREQPSENCWDTLSRQLDALQQAPPSSQAPLTEAARASASKAVLGSAAAKAGIGALVAGGMIAAGVWLFPPKTEKTLASPDPSPNTLIADTPAEDSLHRTETAVSQIPESSPSSNTTFSEGIPAFLLEESESCVPAEGKPRTLPHADSTREYTPQPAPKADKQAIAPAKNDANTSTNTHAGKTASPEKNGKNQPLQPELRIPNVITPNGDNINDYFVIENLEMTEGNRLVIYNRYNKVVFERKNYGNNWNADNLPDGVYRYWLSFEYDGHEFMRQGSIKVMR